MLQSYTRNYADNSTEAGFQFTFYCDNCSDGFKSSFIESETYKKGMGIRGLARGASALGGILGGAANNLGWGVERAGDIIGERFEERSPEWQKEHEKAFELARNEATQHFHRCHSCSTYVCDACINEEEGLCIVCAPRQNVYVAKAHSDAMRRNIDEASQSATVWQGEIESKTTSCPQCGKPSGNGKFCNNCGAPLALNVCQRCGAENAQGIRFCNNCGNPMGAATPQSTGLCPSCGTQNDPATNFCGSCGTKLK